MECDESCSNKNVTNLSAYTPYNLLWEEYTDKNSPWPQNSLTFTVWTLPKYTEFSVVYIGSDFIDFYIDSVEPNVNCLIYQTKKKKEYHNINEIHHGDFYLSKQINQNEKCQNTTVINLEKNSDYIFVLRPPQGGGELKYLRARTVWSEKIELTAINYNNSILFGLKFKKSNFPHFSVRIYNLWKNIQSNRIKFRGVDHHKGDIIHTLSQCILTFNFT
ncbi:hypothetical protein HZS_717 [Henneguya salminicola]|nr:hypothetical protein HZS_717 [Henneguya salminicola]